MSGPAHVHSVEAIESVKSSLTDFAAQVGHALTLLDQEMRRVLDWLEHDRPKYWKVQIHRATDEVAEARAALHRCLMFPVADERPSCREERGAVRRAQARLAYCEEKAARLKHWIREVRREMFEYEGRVSRLSRVVELDVPQAVALLTKLLRRLEDYQTIAVRSTESSYDDLQLAAQLFAEPNDGNDDAPATEKNVEIPRENNPGDNERIDTQQPQDRIPQDPTRVDPKPEY